MKTISRLPVSAAAALALLGALTLSARCAAAPDTSTKAAAPPLVVNGGFEQGDTVPAGWIAGSADATHRLSISSTVFHTGKHAAMTVVDAGAGPSYACYTQYVPVVSGNTYTFTAWVKGDNVQGNVGWFVHVYKGSSMVVNQTLNTNPALPGWSQVSTTLQVEDGADAIQIGTSLYGTGTAYFDDAELTKAPKAVSLLPIPAQPPYHLKLSAGKTAGGISPVIPFGYGLCTYGHLPPSEFKLYQNAGFRLIRSDFHWQEIEQTPGVYDFKAYDTDLAQQETTGTRPVWILDYTNTNYDSNQPPHTEEGLQAYARFAQAAAAHFRNCGVIWEIWNEPNEPNFWSTGPNADQYAALVKAAVPALRASDPNAVILAGSISQFNIPYITAFLKNNPLKGVTALSIHPYREGQPESVITDYAKVRSLMVQYAPAGQKQVPIVCSEWGYTTATGQTSEADQARYLTRMYLTNLMCGVNMTINYNWVNDGSDPASSENRYGILNQDLTPKPAYTEISTLLNTLTGYQFRHRIRGASSADYKLLFQSPHGLALVSWTSDEAASVEAQTPRITKVGKGSPAYAGLMRLALAKTSPDDRPYPDVLPKVPGIVTVLTSTGTPPAQEAAAVTSPGSDQPLLNGSFESGTSGWMPSALLAGQRLGITKAVSRTGSQSAFMSAEPSTAASWFNWGQTVLAVTPGDHYTFTGWLKKVDVHGPSGWYVHVSDTNGQVLYNNTLTSQVGYSGWDKVSTDFTIPPGGVSITIGTSLYGSGVAYFGDASLVKTGHN